jgi:hypothetical protein
MEGFDLGKKATQFEPYLSLLMANSQPNQHSEQIQSHVQAFNQSPIPPQTIDPYLNTLMANVENNQSSQSSMQNLLQLIQSQISNQAPSGSESEVSFNSTKDSGVDSSHNESL